MLTGGSVGLAAFGEGERATNRSIWSTGDEQIVDTT